MKKLQMLCAVFLGVSFLTASTPDTRSAKGVDWEKAEQHYIANLKSDNSGVVSSAAGFVRKYGMTGAVDELISLLKSDNADHVKMSSALSLIRIGGVEGREAIEEAVSGEESELVVEFYKSLLHASSTVER